jgi:hypothetical protein
VRRAGLSVDHGTILAGIVAVGTHSEPRDAQIIILTRAQFDEMAKHRELMGALAETFPSG